MQVLQIVVSPQVEPVENINPIRRDKIAADYSGSAVKTSFLDMVKSTQNQIDDAAVVQQAQVPKREDTSSVKEKSDNVKPKKSKDQSVEEQSVIGKKVFDKTQHAEKTDKKENPVKPDRIGMSTVKQEKKSKDSEPINDGKNGKNIKTDKQKKTADSSEQKTENLTPENIRWINSSDPAARSDDPDSLIAHAESYDENSKVQENIRLETSQRKSIETPALFLNEQTAKNLQPITKKNEKDSDLSGKGKKETVAKKWNLDKEGKIKVTDFRTEIKQNNLATAKNIPETRKIVSVKYDGNNEAQMTMNLSDKVQQNILSSNTQSASATGSNFQAMLSNQIQQNAGEFVKAGSIVLKDNNAGTINLVLKPENLGNVKISLQLTDKIVSGQITVDSKEAYNAFKESADNLKQAFIQSGFDTKGFDISWSGQGSGNNFSGNKNSADQQFVMTQAYNDYSTENVAAAGSTMSEETLYHDHSVNIVA